MHGAYNLQWVTRTSSELNATEQMGDWSEIGVRSASIIVAEQPALKAGMRGNTGVPDAHPERAGGERYE